MHNNNCAKCEAPAGYTEGLPPYGDCYNYSTTTVCGKSYYKKGLYKCTVGQKCELGKCVDDTTYSWVCQEGAPGCYQTNNNPGCSLAYCSEKTDQYDCNRAPGICRNGNEGLWVSCGWQQYPELYGSNQYQSCCSWKSLPNKAVCKSSQGRIVDDSYCNGQTHKCNLERPTWDACNAYSTSTRTCRGTTSGKRPGNCKGGEYLLTENGDHTDCSCCGI